MSQAERILITGGAGFIGSHLVGALLERGHDVVVIDDLSSGKVENLDAAVADATRAVRGGERDEAGSDASNDPSDRLQVIEASILDREALTFALEGASAVLHQAAIPSVPRSFADPASTMRANVEGTTRVLEACRLAGVRRIAMASSSSVYGDTPTLPKEEGMVPCPMSPYALSKLSAEQSGGIFADAYGLEVFALRYFNVFGARQDPNSEYSAVIPKFITRMMVGDAPVINGDGMQSRDFTYIDNVVSANLLAAGVEKPAQASEPSEDAAAADAPAREDTGATRAGTFHAMNIGCGDRFTLLDLVASLNSILGTGLAPEHGEPRPGDVRHSHASIDRARAVIGYEPRIDFQEGLRRTVTSFRGS